MGQGMDDKIRQISEMLNSPEAQEGIRHLFSSFGAPRADASESGPQSAEITETGSALIPAQQPSQERDWIYHIQNMLNQVNNIQDTRINLLRSVHPFLSPSRRERCSTCINILKIAGMLRAFTNNGGRLI